VAFCPSNDFSRVFCPSGILSGNLEHSLVLLVLVMDGRTIYKELDSLMVDCRLTSVTINLKCLYSFVMLYRLHCYDINLSYK